MDLQYEGVKNSRQKSAISSALGKCVCFLPFWVNEVTVICGQTPSEADSALEMCALPQYRKLTVYVYESFYSLSKKGQMDAMQHEVFHALTWPLYDWVRTTLLSPLEKQNDALYQALSTRFDELNEALTEDIRIVFEKSQKEV